MADVFGAVVAPGFPPIDLRQERQHLVVGGTERRPDGVGAAHELPVGEDRRREPWIDGPSERGLEHATECEACPAFGP